MSRKSELPLVFLSVYLDAFTLLVEITSLEDLTFV
jgi:hypothetical protein